MSVDQVAARCCMFNKPLVIQGQTWLSEPHTVVWGQHKTVSAYLKLSGLQPLPAVPQLLETVNLLPLTDLAVMAAAMA